MMKKIEEIEEKIKEERLIEANQKGLFGQNGKIIIVLKAFGEPIVSQNEGGLYFNQNYLEDPYNTNENLEQTTNSGEFLRDLPVWSMDNIERPTSSEWSEVSREVQYSTTKLGYHFCGLSRGMHMEIKYEDSSAELCVSYKGYPVYRESKGDLSLYVPSDEWENNINKLYVAAKERLRVLKEKEFQKTIKVSDSEKQGWLDKMKKRWGFSL
jgi:hypothetical protein